MGIITAIVSAITGIATSANQSATAQLLTYRQEDQNSIEFTRQKDLTFYNAYANQMLVFGLIALVGFIFIIAIIYFNRTK